MLRYLTVCAILLAGLGLQAEIVHVQLRANAGEIIDITDSTVETGVRYSSGKAPTLPGYVFTHWTLSADQPFRSRDAWGRALDEVTFVPYEATILTANYLASDVDTDQDGLADGVELYWYGDLDEGASSDTDEDGVTFREEVEAGTNPHFADGADGLGVLYDGVEGVVYNPHSYPVYTFRSEPEGVLFETVTDVAEPGSLVRSPVCSQNSSFARWEVGGTACRDAFGRALDVIEFEMPQDDVTAVAVTISDAKLRAQSYWYGQDVDMASDTDGDGFTFAQEIELGTNPLFPDDDSLTGVASDGVDGVLYNPQGQKPYIVRSDDGSLFTDYEDYALPGTTVRTPVLDPNGSTFAYWTVDGKIQRDAFGRALDSVSAEIPSEGVEIVAHSVADAADRAKMYWYGSTETDLLSDTDGDGYTLADEIANGTNPLFADDDAKSGVGYDGIDDVEVNLQSHELVGGFVVGGKYVAIQGGTGVAPVVSDVNGDGLWDLIVVSEDSTRVFVNVGSTGNPAFEEREGVDIRGVDLRMNSTEKLGVMSLDIQPVAALSATVWGEDTLLVSDADGRIWYYRNGNLQHKVWGGSCAGFANGLRLAAVDWDDDGDLDCLAGTAEGKLMLLRDPKIGRPTNLKALVGVDNVKLDWDPNQQSRIRGYKVYRADAGADGFTCLVSPYTPLPTYRDYPPSVSDFDYKVSSVSRHYVAGSSAPVVSESLATEPVRVSLGKVSLHWTDMVVKRGETFSLMLSIDNSANLSPEGMAIEIEYDRAVLNLLKTLPSGLFEQSKIAPGSGKLYEYVFEIVDGEQGAVETSVSVKGATMYGVGGAAVGVALPKKNAVVSIAAGGSAPYQLGDLNGDGEIDALDLRELAKLKSAAGRKWTANQLKAGDFNGNGKLDEADYQALRDLLKEKGLL